ncbi:MAG: hypothetical protein AAB317_03990 [Nitrospirota bacterium]
MDKPPIKPVIAAILSLVFAGLGHFFIRQYVRGVLFLIPSLFLWKLADYWSQMALANLIIFIFAAFDSFSLEKRGIGIV